MESPTDKALFRAILVFIGGGLFTLIVGFFTMVDYAPDHEPKPSPVYRFIVRAVFFPAHFFPREESFLGMLLGLLFWSVLTFWLSKRYFMRKNRVKE